MSSDISTNKKARRDYEILDTYECGMELKGTEVKSIRAGKVNIADSFARVENGQMLLYGCTSSPGRQRENSSSTRRAGPAAFFSINGKFSNWNSRLPRKAAPW